MENFIQVKENIVKQAIEKKACEDQLERVKTCETWEELKEVIIDNFWWCLDKNIELLDDHYKNSEREFTIVNGKLHGEYKSWGSDGELFEHCTYKKGKRDGEFKKWYRNGQLWEQFFCKNNKFHGKYKKWWSNGELAEKKYYTNGEINKFRTFIFKYFNI
jgi:antitoxin component YwqK of YwqJK toxin-antitoxin module